MRSRVKPVCILLNVSTENVPREIIAQGARAVEAYELACASGTQPIRRTRLMLVGQENAGKTSLKRALTGQGHDCQEEKTDGIEVTWCCSLSGGTNQASWCLPVKGEETARRERLEASVDLGVLGGEETLAEEQDLAVATNLALEVMVKLRQDTGLKPVFRDAQTIKEAGPSSSERLQSPNKDILVMSQDESSPFFTTTILEDVPAQVAHMAKEILHRKQAEDARDKDVLDASVTGKTSHHLQTNTAADRKNSESQSRMKEEHKESATSTRDNMEFQKGGCEGQAESDQKVILSIWDFAGQAAYYTTHQVFLTSRAVYCLVFNLCDDLSMNPAEPGDKTPSGTLQYLDFWMRSIHAHAAENTKNDVTNTTLSPPIVVVGTHRDKLAADADGITRMVDEKWATLREFLVGKPYAQNVVLPFFAVENNRIGVADPEIMHLREELEKVARQQSYMGEHIPTKWLRFEHDITSQADQGVNFATYNQVAELAANHSIIKREEVAALLQFYHDLGLLVHYPGDRGLGSDLTLSNTVVLNPQWLIDMFMLVTANFPPKEKWGVLADKWSHLINHGILEESLLPSIWPDTPDDHRSFLLALMAKFDLLCKRLPPAGQSHRYPSQSWYIPMRFGPVKDKKKVYAQTNLDALFYIDFNSFLPEGLFHRLQARAIVWSQERGGRDLSLSQGLARLFVDGDHDVAIEMCTAHLHRIKILVMHVKDKEATSSKRSTAPTPEAVAKVRNFLETSLSELRSLWMKRLAYKFCFPCPCRKVCDLHQVEACPDQDCMHFLDLDECLTSQIVCCEHRRVQTESFKKWFPSSHSNELKEPVIGPVHIEQSFGNIERHMPNLPSWLKGAAKLLNGAPDNQDWMALARTMGYKQNRIETLNEDLNPSLALLTDWIVSSGNTTMSVDVLLHYLKHLGCNDVADIILQAKEHELERPQVFLSYQWDAQDQVAALRDHLERAGYSCWMDIGQMGGGDQLSTKIDQGLRGCK
ncbi:protein neuralized, partial [Plakobranchus ocellatus]